MTIPSASDRTAAVMMRCFITSLYNFQLSQAICLLITFLEETGDRWPTQHGIEAFLFLPAKRQVVGVQPEQTPVVNGDFLAKRTVIADTWNVNYMLARLGHDYRNGTGQFMEPKLPLAACSQVTIPG